MTGTRNHVNGQKPATSLDDIPLERAIIGRLLCRMATPAERSDSLIDLLDRNVRASAFARIAHQTIFNEIVVCAEETGVAGDHAVIERRLRDRGTVVWQDVDGDYILALAEAEPHSFIPLGLTDRLIDLSRRRALLRKARQLTDILNDPISQLEDAIDFADGLTVHLDVERTDDDVLGEISTTAELFARVKPLRFLVRNFLTIGTLAVWAAPEKLWKTTLAVMLALVVTGNGRFLGEYEATETGPVIFFSGESGDNPLHSMMMRILDWMHPSDVMFDGMPISLKPDPAQIPIHWAGDPPDLGNPSAVAALKRTIIRLGAKLLILDPSQAMFGSISDDMKTDAAMRQYVKKLQTLARETGCAVLLLHHFRQHVLPGFPKRSDSSYGGFMKFCDTWILANTREAQNGDEEPGSGSLWLSWGSRDGFGGSLGIDIQEGVHPNRFFDCQTLEVGPTLELVAARQAERKGQSTKAVRRATTDNHKTAIREALANKVVGVSRETLAGIIGMGRTTINPIVAGMVDAGELIVAPVEYGNHGKICWTDGVALPHKREIIETAAKVHGWKPAQNGTGVTGDDGCQIEQPSPVGTEGNAPPVGAPLREAPSGVALAPSRSGRKRKSKNRHPAPVAEGAETP
ncbi:MAG: hypothetical protein EXS05_12355 [Planctomycetaceae bacterium]|nr:hypothetical protein [Planctomycetaceae bacterium]